MMEVPRTPANPVVGRHTADFVHSGTPRVLTVRVCSANNEYALTIDDVWEVFSEFGEIANIYMNSSCTEALVVFVCPDNASMARNELNNRDLKGIDGYLSVEFSDSCLPVPHESRIQLDVGHGNCVHGNNENGFGTNYLINCHSAHLQPGCVDNYSTQANGIHGTASQQDLCSALNIFQSILEKGYSSNSREKQLSGVSNNNNNISSDAGITRFSVNTSTGGAGGLGTVSGLSSSLFPKRKSCICGNNSICSAGASGCMNSQCPLSEKALTSLATVSDALVALTNYQSVNRNNTSTGSGKCLDSLYGINSSSQNNVLPPKKLRETAAARWCISSNSQNIKISAENNATNYSSITNPSAATFGTTTISTTVSGKTGGRAKSWHTLAIEQGCSTTNLDDSHDLALPLKETLTYPELCMASIPPPTAGLGHGGLIRHSSCTEGEELKLSDLGSLQSCKCGVADVRETTQTVGDNNRRTINKHENQYIEKNDVTSSFKGPFLGDSPSQECSKDFGRRQDQKSCKLFSQGQQSDTDHLHDVAMPKWKTFKPRHHQTVHERQEILVPFVPMRNALLPYYCSTLLCCDPLLLASLLRLPDHTNIKKYTIRYAIQIPPYNGFEIAKRIIGNKGCHMKAIYKQTSAKLRLRGYGSGYQEGINKTEANEPLHLCVSSESLNNFLECRLLVEDFLTTLYAEFERWCTSMRGPHSNLSLKATITLSTGPYKYTIINTIKLNIIIFLLL